MLNLKSKIAAGIALAVLTSYAAVGAFAAPGITPWPDLGPDASDHATLPDLPDAAGVSEDVSLPELPADPGMPEDAGVPEGAPFGPPAVLGVPTDSPACDELVQHGCDVVELPNGLMINLPQPAVDGINQAQQNVPLGPPADLPLGPPEGLPDAAPFGPPSDVPLGPPAGVPQP